MEHSSKSALPRVVLAVMIVLVIGAAAVLVWLLVSPGGTETFLAPSETAVPATAEPTASPTPVPTPTATPEPSPEPSATPVPVELTETEDAGQEYIDKIVFLGDSTTYGLGAYNVLPFTQIWADTIGTLALFNWEIDPIAYYDPADPYNAQELSIPDCAARRQPEYLMITLGINGIALLDEAQFKDYYVRMIQAIQQASPDTKIICQTIYPVIDSYVPNGISNEKVNAANQWIYDIAAETGTRYLNSHDVLMDQAGQLNAAYTDDTAMGIHLNGTGFSVLLQNIRTHAWQ